MAALLLSTIASLLLLLLTIELLLLMMIMTSIINLLSLHLLYHIGIIIMLHSAHMAHTIDGHATIIVRLLYTTSSTIDIGLLLLLLLRLFALHEAFEFGGVV